MIRARLGSILWAVGVPSGRGVIHPVGGAAQERDARVPRPHPLGWHVVTGGTAAGETSRPFSVSQAFGRRPQPQGFSDSAC